MIYWIVFFISLFVVLCLSKVDYDKNTLCKLYVLLIIALGVFRDTTIGTDIKTPLGGYYMLWKDPFNINDLENVEYGFLCFSYIIKFIWSSYYFYYGSIFALTMGFYFFSAKKMNINPAVFFAILFMSSTIISSYNVIRQILALSAVVLAYSLLLYKTSYFTAEQTKKLYLVQTFLYELFVILLSIGFHFSTIVLTILPLFGIKKIQNVLTKDLVLWFLLFVVVFVNFYYGKYIQQFVIIAQSYLHVGGRAEFWVDVVEQYGESIEASHGLATIIISGSIAILASRSRRNVLFYIGYCGFLLSSLASTNLGTVGRLFDNLSIFLIFYYAQIIGELLKSYKLFSFDARWLILFLFIFDWSTGFYFTTILNKSISPYQTYLF